MTSLRKPSRAPAPLRRQRRHTPAATLALAFAALLADSASAQTLTFQGGAWDDPSANWRNASGALVTYWNSTDTAAIINGPLEVGLAAPRTAGSLTLNNGVSLYGQYLLLGGNGFIHGAGATASSFSNRILTFPGAGSTLSLRGRLIFNGSIESGSGNSLLIDTGSITTLSATGSIFTNTLHVGNVGATVSTPTTLNTGAGATITTTGAMVVGQTLDTFNIVSANGTTFNLGGDLRLGWNGDATFTVDGGALNVGGALRIADHATTFNNLPTVTMTLRNTTLTVADSAGAGIRGDYFVGPGFAQNQALNLPGTTVKVRAGGFLTIANTIELGLNRTIFDTTSGDMRIDGRLWGGQLIKTGSGTLTLNRDNQYGNGGGGVLDGTVVNGGFIEFHTNANFGTGVTSPTGLKNIQLNGGGLRWAAGNTTDISARLRSLNNFSFDTNGNNVAFGTALFGTGGMTKHGAGILRLASGGTYTGGTTIKGGLVEFAAANAFGTGAITLDGGGVRWATDSNTDLSGRLAFGAGGGVFDTNGNNVALAAGSLVGSSTVTKIGAGALVLQGAQPWTGSLVADGGVIALSNTTLANLQNLTVGQAGAGYLDLDDSTLATSGPARIGGGAGQTGTARVDGFSTLTTGTFLEVGSGGTGTLEVTEGAQVFSTTSTALGVSPGSTGTLILAGLGGAVGTRPASLTTGTHLWVGYQSTGTVDIDDGGLATVGGQLRLAEIVGSSGAVIVRPGGTLAVGGTDGIVSGAGSFALDLAGGTLKVHGSSLTTSVPLTLSRTSTVDTDGLDAFFQGALGGAGGLAKTGAGALHLSAPGTYSGGTQVLGGQLVVTAANTLGTGAITVQGGSLHSTGTFSRDVPVTVTGPGSSLTAASYLEIGVGGAGSLAVSHGGTVSTPGSLAFAVLPGGTSGGATVTGAGSSLSTGNIIFLGYQGGGFLGIGAGGTVNAGGPILFGSESTGVGTLNLDGGGTLAVGGTDGLAKGAGTANLNLSGGTLRVTGSALTTSVPATLTHTTTIDTNGLGATFSGTLSGGGGLAKTGAGTLVLDGVHTYTGGTTVSAGTLQLGNGGSGGSLTGDIVNHGSVVFQRSGDRSFGGVISGSGSLVNNGNILRLAAAQTYTGATSLQTGILVLAGVDQALAAATRVDISAGASLDLSNRAHTVSGLSGYGTVYSFGGGDGRLTVNTAAGENQTFAGQLGATSSAFAFTKAGAGTLTLSGINHHTGGTTITGGQLFATSVNALGGGAITVQGGSLHSEGNFSRDVPITVTGPGSSFSTGGDMQIGVGLAGSLAVSHGGTVSTPGSLAFAVLPGGTAGSATVTGTGSSLSTGGTIRLGDRGGGFLGIGAGGVVNAGGQILFGAESTGVGTLNLDGGGTLAVGGIDGLAKGAGTANFNLSGGTLRVTGSALTTSVPATLTHTTTIDTNGLGATFSGTLSGGGGLAKTGAGTLVLDGAHTYTGGTTVSAGTLQFGNGGSLVGDIVNHGSVVFQHAGDQSFGGVISGTGSLVNNGNILRLATAQTYTGATALHSGILVLPGVDQALARSTTLAIAPGASLDISNRALTISGLSGSGSIYSFGDGAGHLTVDTASGQNQTFAGQLGASFPDFAFTKSGAGTLTLSGTNNHTGRTTISGGTLALGLNGSIANSAGVALGTNGILDLTAKTAGFAFGPAQSLTGTGTVSLASGQALTVAGTLAPGNSPGLVTIHGDLVLAGTSTTQMELGGLVRGVGHDAIDVAGTLGFGGTLTVTLVNDFTPVLGDSFRLFTFSSFGGTFSQINLPALDASLSWNISRLYDEGTLTISAVPEPSTFAVLAGLATLAFASTRRRRRA